MKIRVKYKGAECYLVSIRQNGFCTIVLTDDVCVGTFLTVKQDELTVVDTNFLVPLQKALAIDSDDAKRQKREEMEKYNTEDLKRNLAFDLPSKVYNLKEL